MTFTLYRIPDQHLARARGALRNLVHAVDGHHVVSATSARVLGERVRALRSLEAHALDSARWDSTANRLSMLWAAMVSEPVPDEVAHEARLMLYADPALELEFMGRGEITAERHLPAPRATIGSAKALQQLKTPRTLTA